MKHWDVTLKQVHLVMNKHQSADVLDKEINFIHPAHFGLDTSTYACDAVHKHASNFRLE